MMPARPGVWRRLQDEPRREKPRKVRQAKPEKLEQVRADEREVRRWKYDAANRRS